MEFPLLGARYTYPEWLHRREEFPLLGWTIASVEYTRNLGGISQAVNTELACNKWMHDYTNDSVYDYREAVLLLRQACFNRKLKGKMTALMHKHTEQPVGRLH